MSLSGVASVRARPKRKWRTHILAVGCPEIWGGWNSQPCAACRAFLAKYLLGPGEVSFVLITLPEESTSTRTLTLMFPVIVFLALCGISGRT